MNSPAPDRMKHSRKPWTDGRRFSRRYPIVLDARWRLPKSTVSEAGTGATINLSSGGVLFQADRQMPAGARIELSIAWPVLLRNVAPLQLRVIGDIVRVRGREAAVRIGEYEFRTVGMVWAGPGKQIAGARPSLAAQEY